MFQDKKEDIIKKDIEKKNKKEENNINFGLKYPGDLKLSNIYLKYKLLIYFQKKEKMIF